MHLPNWHFSLYLPLSFCDNFYPLAPRLLHHLPGKLFPKLSTPDLHLRWSWLKKVFTFLNPMYALVLRRFPSVFSNWSTYSFPPRCFPPHLRCNNSKQYACARSVRCHSLTSYLKAWTQGYYQQDSHCKEYQPAVHSGETTINVSTPFDLSSWLFPLLSLTPEHFGRWINHPHALTPSSASLLHSSWK